MASCTKVVSITSRKILWEQIARAETNAQIAERLTISLKTVRNHVSNIYSK
jgi:DNA-binding NarL/FixJ family response regulator